jgi:hypothetical protein
MATAMTSKTGAVKVGRFLVVHCLADDDGPEGWEIREGEDVLDSHDTRREAIAEAKRMEADRAADDLEERIDSLRQAIDTRIDELTEGPNRAAVLADLRKMAEWIGGVEV